MDSESKHIIIVGPAFPYRGGLATYNELLAERLQQAGHRVELVTFRLQYPSLLFPGKTQYGKRNAPEKLKIHRWINSILPWNWVRMGLRIRNREADLVILRYWTPFMAPSLGVIARLVRKGKTKVVAITDNVIPHERRPLDRTLTRYFLRSCNAFVCMSKAVLEDLKAFRVDQPSAFHPHPMYESFGPAVSKADARHHLQLDPDARYLLFFGFIRAYKGLDILLEAMGDERLRDMDVRLVVAGEYYEDSGPYTRIMHRDGIKGRIVERTHFIPDSEVRYYFCASDMVVQTYKDATQSGVTQVAYFYERPMLVTDVGGLAELVPHGKVGYVCPVESRKVADALVDFYSNDREAELVEGVREERQRFSWDSMIQCLLDVV